jgi:phosphatidylserine/phosphatidylglycerophosphate/cardiolipin synthase-like enzyme
MANVALRAYLSPTLVLLAFDWEDSLKEKDFLGFQITRASSAGPTVTLLNRLTFSGPVQGSDVPSSLAPIQKFEWWDASIPVGSAVTYTYTVTPLVGAPNALKPVTGASGAVKIRLPEHVTDGIGSWFNRAVVSSQAFSRLLIQMGLDARRAPSQAQEKALRSWLGNGLETVVPEFLATAQKVAGAVYHLTDNFWIVPALDAIRKPVEIVYDSHLVNDTKSHAHKPSPNQATIDSLAANNNVKFFARDKTNIMHDKFLVDVDSSGAGRRVLCGSANFTSDGLSTQANLLHTFDSPALADFFLERKRLIQSNPPVKDTAEVAKWSQPARIDGAQIRVFFSPESTKSKESIDDVVAAIEKATSSVVFCLFDPTDIPLLDACFEIGDTGRMMFGLVNHIKRQDPSQSGGRTLPAEITIYHRNRNNHDVIGPNAYGRDNTPQGFLPEQTLFPGGHGQGYAPVIIHHKFIVIDGETGHPVIFSGSANMSQNSVHKNDEALLEITGTPRLGQLYLAEFIRLYENYRARAKLSGASALALAKDSSWCRKYFVKDSPEEKSRIAMAAALSG